MLIALATPSTHKKRTAGKKPAVRSKKTHQRAVAVKSGQKRKKKAIAGKRSHKRRHTVARGKSKSAGKKPKYAYALDLFMRRPPAESLPALSAKQRRSVKSAFRAGFADRYSPNHLVASGVFDASVPLLGGIFNRRKSVEYVILHSTETGRPAPGERVIRSWNHGLRHPGAQYVVDRDGTIYQTVDPQYGTVHVDIFRTHGGVNNDNSIGIEIVRAGGQRYTKTQLSSVTRLVTYLQGRYRVDDAHVVGHGQVQPSNRTDPVNFDWVAFENAKSLLKAQAAAKFKQRLQTALMTGEVEQSEQSPDENADDAGSVQFEPAAQTPVKNDRARRWTLSFCRALFS
jgi:hypothetical protein